MSVNASIMSDVFVGIGERAERRRSSAEDTVGGQCELSGVCLTAVYGEQLKRQTVPLQYQHDGWIYIYINCLEHNSD